MCHAKDKRVDVHKDHVAGVRILTDLRAARWMLDHWPGGWLQAKDVVTAEKEIDDAITDLGKASIEDGEGTEYHLPVDNRADTIGRLREAVDFLTTAQEHLVYDKPGKFTKDLRSTTIKHITSAIASLNKAIAAAEKLAKQQTKAGVPARLTISNYPTYAHALYNLRAAHWLLAHMPTNWPQAQEEHEAIKQIEAAIYKINRAGITDGKAIEIDSPAGVEPEHINHLKAAYSFLKKAREDVAHGEEDAYTRQLRGPLYTYIDEAFRNVIIAEHIFTSDEPLLTPVHRMCPLPTGLDGVIYLYH